MPASHVWILAAKVLIVGLGGLGCPVVLYLAGGGVGTLGVVDSDLVELSNLPRQIIYTTDDVGKDKVAVVSAQINKLNPEVKVVPRKLRLSSDSVKEVLKSYDLVVDCSDNFPTRYLLNDACVEAKKTLVYGALFQFEGQVMVVSPSKSACYRCLFPAAPPPGLVPSCQEVGVLGALAGVIGLLQATETLKLILGIGEPLIGKLIIFNALEMNFRRVDVSRNIKCPVCGY